MITTDTILDYLTDKIEKKEDVGPDVFMDAAQKLNVLLANEDDRLIELASTVANLKLAFLKDNPNVSASKVRTEASEEYKQMRKQDAKCKRIVEFIRLAKLRSRLISDEIKGY